MSYTMPDPPTGPADSWRRGEPTTDEPNVYTHDYAAGGPLPTGEPLPHDETFRALDAMARDPYASDDRLSRDAARSGTTFDWNGALKLLRRADALLGDALRREFETSRQAAEEWRRELRELSR